MSFSRRIAILLLLGFSIVNAATVRKGENWLQFKYDSRHSGNAANRNVTVPLGLIAAVPLTDAVFTAPVVADGRVYVVDGSGTVFCLDAATLRVLWKVTTAGGPANSNNVSSPLIAGRFLHFGTMAGTYYVLDAKSGKTIKEIACGEPIFSAPVLSGGRVYFATLGSRVYALEPNGTVRWTWDFVREWLKFEGDRWSGADWLKHLQHRVTPAEQFTCSRDMAVDGKTLVIPAGGYIVWLDDLGPRPELRRVHAALVPTFGLSIGDDGTVYRQWYYMDNIGQVDMVRPAAKKNESPTAAGGAETVIVDKQDRRALMRPAADKEGVDYVSGTRASFSDFHSSFSSVSLRGGDVYRCRPEEGFGLCRHTNGQETHAYPGGYPSIASPILLGDKAVYGGLDGALYVVPLAQGPAWSFQTPWHRAISAPVAVSDGRVYFGCEDGYFYALGPGGRAPLPAKDLGVWKIRTPLTGPKADAKYDRFTSFGNFANTNADDQGLRLPLSLGWVRRYEGSTLHHSSFGGGRMYTHTAEGQIFAVEQATGRLLWRTFFPGVHVSYTTPLYYQERLLVPQPGFDRGVLRCLDAATGKLLWEAPISGSPSWNRMEPPVVYKNLAFYMFGTGKYGPGVPLGERVPWLFGHQNVPGFPKSHKPLLRAFDLQTGKEVWTDDFSKYGSGGDESGICLMDGRLYYSSYFGNKSSPHGITAALEPETGKIVWLTTDYSVHGGASISAADGRLYLTGYNPEAGSNARRVWCLNAKDGALVWKSDSLTDHFPQPARAGNSGLIEVATIGPKFIFVQAQYECGFLLDKQTGKIISQLTQGYKCTRFTLSGNYLLGNDMDVYDLSDPTQVRFLATGPMLDPSECIGAAISNGQLFYTGHGGGMQMSLVNAKQ